MDTGDKWPIKKWQLDIVADILAGKPEVWAVLPQGNAKTTLMAAVALYHADFIPNPWVPIGAASREQAEILFAQAQWFVEQTPELQGRFRVYEGYRKIVPLDTEDRPGTGRGIKVYAADEKTGDGVIPTMAIVDEGHRHKNLALYRLWRGKLRKRTINRTWSGKLTPRRGTIIMISTAGEPGADFERTRENLRNKATTRTRRGSCYLRAEGPSWVIHEYSVPNPKMAYDLEIVKEANPLMTISVADLAEALESPSLDFGEDWLRLTCNIPARSSKAAISEIDWDNAYTDERIPEGVPVAVGADFAWVLDTTALVPLWIRDIDFRLLGEATILTPPGNGVMLDPEDVHEAFRMIHARNPIYMVVMDMTKAQETAQWLQDELGVEMIVDRTQNNTHAIEDYESFTEALRGTTNPEDRGRIPWVRHVGDEGLRSHIMHAIARKLPGDKYRFDRPAPSRSQAFQDTRVIDALQSAAMVHRTAVAELTNVPSMPLVAVVAR